MRQLHSLYSRRYSVAVPQHLWHIDGNHKLISAIHYCYIFLSCVYNYAVHPIKNRNAIAIAHSQAVICFY